MKTFREILILMSIAVGFVACRGQEDDSVKLQLIPSSQSIAADGQEEVTFKVLYGANDVTADAQILLVSHPEYGWNGEGGQAFTTTEEGEYIFKATYLDLESEEVQITASPVVGHHSSRFERHICVMDFTGAWCTFCPEGYRTLKSLIENPYAGWKEVVTVLALHDSTGGSDPMALPITNTIHGAFGLPSFPAFVTDLRDGGLLTESLDKIRTSFETSIDNYPAQCDVKIASSLAGEVVSVDVTLFAELADEYGVSVWLVENNVNGPQKDGSAVYDSWNHEHVVRALLSAHWKGDALGNLAPESEGSKSYTYTLNGDWKVEDLSIVALAITPDGYVNNVAECKLGESVEYKYITE